MTVPLPRTERDAILDELAKLRRRVAALEAARVGRDDRSLLAAIFRSVEGRVFSAVELQAHALIQDELSELRGLTRKQIGKRLRAMANRDLGGLCLIAVGRDDGGRIWSVQVATDLHEGHSNRCGRSS